VIQGNPNSLADFFQWNIPSTHTLNLRNSSSQIVTTYDDQGHLFGFNAGLYPTANNTYDLGVSPSNTWRSLYLSTSLVQNGVARLDASGNLNGQTLNSNSTLAIQTGSSFRVDFLFNEWKPPNGAVALGDNTHKFADIFTGGVVRVDGGTSGITVTNGGGYVQISGSHQLLNTTINLGGSTITTPSGSVGLNGVTTCGVPGVNSINVSQGLIIGITCN
jgi:hypothetical protein